MFESKISINEAKALRAKELKQRYGVYGFFYDQVIKSENYACRSLLELVNHEITPLELNKLKHEPIDALCIMMNPGSSKPVDQNYNPKHIKSINNIYDEVEYVPTKPDNTQYQLLRVMSFFGLNHVRILNLSDIREPKSPLFIEKINKLDLDDIPGVHSIFSKDRNSELKKLSGTSGTPVLLAWGRDARLTYIAKTAFNAIQARKIAGVQHADESYLYAHASPMLQSKKEEWLESICTTLAK